MRVAAVIQARMGSTRLPGKVLKDLSGRPVLVWVMERLRHAAMLDDIIVATTNSAEDDEIAALCQEEAIRCFRGSEQDVLARYQGAAVECGLDAIVRVTADCPLLDPHLVDDVVGTFRGAPDRHDFVANTLNRRYPRGLDASVMSAQALARAHVEATEPADREHVTLYIRDARSGFRLHSVDGPLELGHWRWTIDEPSDLDFLNAVFERLVPFHSFSWWHVYRLLHEEPALLTINQTVAQKDPHAR